MKYYFSQVLDLLKRLGIVLVLFTFTRLFFYFFNLSLFSDVSFGELMKALIVGIRFDISVVIYFNLVIILMHLLPVGKGYYNKNYQRIILYYFVIVNALLLLINLGDAVFFHFTLKRSTIDVVKFIFISGDVLNLLPRFMVDYWFVPLVFVVVLFILVYANRFVQSGKQSLKKLNLKAFSLQFLLMLLFLGMFMIGARGGLQGIPLSIMHANASTNAKLAPIALNTPFTLMKTFSDETIVSRNYFEAGETQKYYQVIKQPSGDLPFQHKNVIILLLESFSKEYVGSLSHYKGYTPFLDSLIGHSLVFTNAYSNGYRSMDAMPAMLMSVPCLMNDPIITSAYSTNNFTAFAKLLKTKSYTTAFFHGGNEGTLGLDGFAKLSGFDKFYGRAAYNNDDDNDGYWGIYDEPFLQYVIKNIDGFTEPFFVTEFTLSSHYPYSLPEKYESKFKEGPLRIHRVVRYTDYALKRFFEVAQTKPWFNNTIFIISADHPAQSVIPSKSENVNEKDNLPDEELLQYYKNSSGRYAIPILIYAPGDSSLQGEISTTMQQADVMPTILNLLHFGKPYIAFGNDVFDSTATHAAFQYVHGLYQITSGNYCLLFDGEKSVALYEKSDVRHLDNLLEKEPGKTLELENILKAYLQEFSHRLRENKLMVE